MKRRILIFTALLLLAALSAASCSPYRHTLYSQGTEWSMGCASVQIPLPDSSELPLYIAGYRNGREAEGVLDLSRATALWMDTGAEGVLLIGIDCIGLGSSTVQSIRSRLADFCRRVNCVSVNVYATHTHAGVDTLGLWGPVAVDGKNSDYMELVISSAVAAAEAAYEDRSSGSLYYGNTVPEELLHDSRRPVEYDPTLYQLRFVPHDSEQNGIRLLSYSAHAESLRGDNLMLSRDFPGALADIIAATCGDDVMLMPGAVGGLIMTRQLTQPFDPELNMRLTAERLAEAALSIQNETPLSSELSVSHVSFKLPLDNTFFMFAEFLGILDNGISRGRSETGYVIHSEVGVLTVGEVTMALIPGEIFPELVSGNGLAEGDPEALSSIAARYGAHTLLVVGLCNDELGYIIPPHDFLLNEELPYIEGVKDATGEDHYEETNSVGIRTAALIASAFEQALKQTREASLLQ